MLKTRCSGLHLCLRKFGYIFNLLRIAPRSYRIWWNNAK